MAKNQKGKKQTCYEHVFKIKPLQERCYYENQVEIDFCELNQSRKVKKPKVKGHRSNNNVIFNKDRNYSTPSFILNFEQEYYYHTFEDLKKQHDMRMKGYTEEKDQLDIAKPKSRSKICNVCKNNYEDYLEHINSNTHKKNIKESKFETYIEDLIAICQRESKKNSNSTSMGKPIVIDQQQRNSLQFIEKPQNRTKAFSISENCAKNHLKFNKFSRETFIENQDFLKTLVNEYPAYGLNRSRNYNRYPTTYNKQQNGHKIQKQNTIPLPPHLDHQNRNAFQPYRNDILYSLLYNGNNSGLGQNTSRNQMMMDRNNNNNNGVVNYNMNIMLDANSTMNPHTLFNIYYLSQALKIIAENNRQFLNQNPEKKEKSVGAQTEKVNSIIELSSQKQPAQDSMCQEVKENYLTENKFKRNCPYRDMNTDALKPKKIVKRCGYKSIY